MRFRAECPHCRGVLLLRDVDAGREVRCPHCKKGLKVPAAPSPSASASGESQSPASPAAGAPSDAAIQLFQEIEAEGQAAEPEVSVRTADGRGLGLAPAPSPPPLSAPAGPTEGLVWPPIGEGLSSSRARRSGAPTVVTVYSIIIMVIQGLWVAWVVILTLLNLGPAGKAGGTQAVIVVLVSATVQVGIAYFLFRIGGDLREGRRWAVVALSVMTGLSALLVTLAWMLISRFQPLSTAGMPSEWAEINRRVAEIRLGIILSTAWVTLQVAACYVPTLVSAYRHWDDFN